MTKKKTHDEYVEEVLQKRSNEIEVLGVYVDAVTKILHRHSCGYEWLSKPVGVLKSSGCPKCSAKKRNDWKRKTQYEYEVEVRKIHGDIDVIGEYVDTRTKILHKHICGHKWLSKPTNILSGFGCPNCRALKIGNALRKGFEEYLKQLKIIHDDIEVLGEYINTNTSILHRHIECGHEWMVQPASLLNGTNCPNCASSKGEKIIKLYLENHQIHYEYEKKYSGLIGLGKGLLSYDFYLPQYNLLIEYQGEFHDGSGAKYTKTNLDKQKEHDRRKKEYAEKNKIEFLEIWYWDFDNIEEILKSKLKIKVYECV